jgi:hypothetical protein
MKRAALAVVFAICVAVVIGYQVTRSPTEVEIGQPFVPSPRFFLDFSPSYRATIADAYWLLTVQYYGEHIAGDQDFARLPAMVELVTRLSPHFERAYLFGAYALLDAGKGNAAYLLLQRGFKENPDAWKLATNAGILMYSYGPDDVKDRIASQWFEAAGKVDGAPPYVSRLAASLAEKGGETRKAVALWAEIFATGDKYSREKALSNLYRILPTEPGARARALDQARDLMAPGTLAELKTALAGQE